MANIIKTDTRDLEKMTKWLRKNSRKGGAIAIAIQQTLNGMAFTGRKRAIRYTIPKVMTVRNKSYVNRSIGVNKVPNGKEISAMESQLGANAKVFGKKAIGWAEMEAGRSVTTVYKGRYGMHATRYARGGDSNKAVKKKNRVSNLNQLVTIGNLIPANKLAKTRQGRNKQLLAIALEKKIKNPFMFETKSGKKGIFEIKGGKLRMLYKLGSRRYGLKRRKWLEPASEYAMRRGDKIYKLNAGKQIARLTKKLGIKYTA